MTERLILCFDGTGNEPADSEAERRLFGLLGTTDESVSNICKLHLLFGGDLKDGQAIEGHLDDDTKPISDVLFENGTLSPSVNEALHLLSLDERRIAFQPTLMNKDDRVTEVWFPGVHSDIGGGFRFDGLSDVTLQFMLDEITRRDLGLQVRDPLEIPYDEINRQSGNCDLDLEDLIIQPNPLGKIHPKKRPAIWRRARNTASRSRGGRSGTTRASIATKRAGTGTWSN